jgi:uncharacterized membrane protein YqhA
MIRALLNKSRYLVIFAVLGAFLASVTLFAFGLIETFVVIVDVLHKAEFTSKAAKGLALTFIEIVDLFLLGTVLQLIALGLYELFIDPTLDLPEWLTIQTLDDLKSKLTAVVIVVMGVLFLGQAVAWDGERDLLGYGAAIALVVAALTWFLSQSKGKG